MTYETLFSYQLSMRAVARATGDENGYFQDRP
jgi:hypothetical protein